MANQIQVVLIKGTDSISTSRIFINENFQILQDEINSIESFLDLESRELSNMYNIISDKISIGNVGDSSFNADTSNVKINKKLTINNIQTIINSNEFIKSSIIHIAPDPNTGQVDIISNRAMTYIIGENGYPNPIIVKLPEKEAGTEITIIRGVLGTSNTFTIDNGDATLLLEGNIDGSGDITTNGTDTIELDNIGDSVTLRYLDEHTVAVISIFKQ